jgi:hypothetical protein
LLSSQGRDGACDRHDDLNLERNQFGRESGQPLDLPLRIPVFDQEVAALDVTKVAQSLKKEVSPLGGRDPAGRQVAYSSDLVRLLRLSGKRRSEEAASNSRDEGSALHYSIT